MKRPASLTFLATFLCLVLFGTFSPAQTPVFHETQVIGNVENIIAVDNACAWPNLTLMPDGSIAALIFNKPSHGQEEGDAVCYVSEDGGKTWQFRGIPIPHKPNTNRMNLAAGLSNDGALVTIVSGWGGKNFREYILPNAVCRSTDGGRTWSSNGVFNLPEGETGLIPFGDIIRLGGKKLAMTAYGYIDRQSRPAYMLFSYDDGLSWGDAVPMGKFGEGPGAWNDFNETAPLRLCSDRWLAAARTCKNKDVQLIVSEDEGKTWDIPVNLKNGALTRRNEHPAHLLALRDGRILLTYGIRWGTRAVAARISEDEGRTWGEPMIIYYYNGKDGSYPASVELEDGTIVTAYYSGTNKNHPRYHMAVLRWKLP